MTFLTELCCYGFCEVVGIVNLRFVAFVGINGFVVFDDDVILISVLLYLVHFSFSNFSLLLFCFLKIKANRVPSKNMLYKHPSFLH